MQVFRLNSKLEKMQSLFVFGEINKYLDTQIIEIKSQPFWNPGPGNQEFKFNNIGEVLELAYKNTGIFEGMEGFQVYKTLRFMTDYEKKQLIKLGQLRDIYTIKCKLSMLCTSTSKGGIRYWTVHVMSPPWRANGYFSEDYRLPDEDLGSSEGYLYNVLDLAIEIQEAKIKNIELVTNALSRDYVGGMPDYNDTTDYKKIETILNRRMCSIGF